MKVIEHLADAKEPLISFEIIPPKRGGKIQGLMATVESLMVHSPPFIDITSHAAEAVYEETKEGIRRSVKRKRPGTLGMCALIQNKYNVDAVPHVLCTGFTSQETEDFLIELQYLGIDNILAIRGDEKGYKKKLQHGRTANKYAVHLVRQVSALNRGQYLEEGLLDAEPMNFCVGVAGYPEKHFESPNLNKDISYTKEKVDAGADYIVCQMHFDNEYFFSYVDACREAGINVPIIPGLKILSRRSQLRSIPRVFHCDIPSALADEIEAADAANVGNVGIEWATQQAQELLDKGVPAVHFYVMQNSKAVNSVIARLKR